MYRKIEEDWVEYGYLLGLENDIIYNLYTDGEYVWIATLEKGVFRFNPNDSTYVQYNEANGLANNHARCSFKDSWENVWIGTSGGGVSKYSGQAFEKWSKENGLKGNYIYSVFEDYKGVKWVGTSGGSLTVLDTATRYLNKENGFLNAKTKAIYQTKDSLMWLGTDGGGLMVWANDTSVKLTSRNGLNSDWIKAFAEDKQGNVWVATSGGGIAKVARDSGLYGIRISNYTLQKGLSSNRITDLEVDDKGRVWYTTQAAGLGCIDGDSLFAFKKENGLKGNNLRSLTLDSNILWIGGTRGLNYINVFSDSLSVKEIQSDIPLTSENIYLLQKDRKQNLWVGSEKGLDRLKLDEQKVIELDHYDASSGFIGVESNTNASMLDQKGNVWFGTIDGLFRYAEQGGEKNELAPKLSWNNVKINGESTRDIFERFPRMDEWILPYGDNRVSFDFIGINHTTPAKVRYKWKLENWDKTFSEPANHHFMEYSNLPPGYYTFMAHAQNEDGIWTERPLYFSFRVATPIWMKTWFIFTSTLIVFFVVLSFYRYRIATLKKRAKQREEKLMLEKNLVELEQKALQLQMNPHFIFHTLNSIQELVATKEEKVARSYLGKFSKLMRQILESSRSEAVTLSEEIDMLSNYLTLEQFSHENKFTFELRLTGDEADFIHIPTMLVQPFVENAIIHGALKSSEEGHVNVLFTVENKHVLCTIDDNGPGLKEKKDNGHKSAAIAITKERLKHLSPLKEEIQIKNKDGTKSGVLVQLLIPIIETT